MTTKTDAKKLSATPKAGKCYRNAAGERVQVISVATERPFKPAETKEDLDARRTLVVIHHKPDHIFGREYSGNDWALTLEDWHKHGFVPISRKEFIGEGRVWSHTSGGWALVAARKPHDSRDIEVRRVAYSDYDSTGNSAEVTVLTGGHFVRVAPLNATTYDYREDAREAKREYCRAHKIPLASTRDHFGAYE
jgi:hypothetical protein